MAPQVASCSVNFCVLPQAPADRQMIGSYIAGTTPRILGQGSFGTVFLVRNTNGRLFAAKVLREKLPAGDCVEIQVHALPCDGVLHTHHQMGTHMHLDTVVGALGQAESYG